MFFGSDNGAPAAPEIIQSILEANKGPALGYGNDPWTRRVEEKFAALFERDVSVLLVATGTAANSIALAALCQPWGAVLCHADAHVNTDEGGAPEFFTHGAKLVTVPGDHGKITGDALAHTIATKFSRPPHSILPHVVTITQATEWGAVYTPEEVADVSRAARAAGIKLHMDGARLANAAVYLGASPAEMTWKAGVDALSFGFTKNGALTAEAVIFFDAEAAKTLEVRRKAGGHLWSKARFLAAQIEPMLEDGLWLRLAAHANTAATRLANGMTALGIPLAAPVEANEVFPRLLPQQMERLRAAGAVFFTWPDEPVDGRSLTRFVCAWSTADSEVEQVLDLLAKA